MPKLERDAEVFVLHLDPDDENRFHPDWLAAVSAALDEVEAAPLPAALVTVGSGKFWSNGLDLAWLLANGEQAGSYVDQVHGLFARVLSSPVPSVAALNGHTFAAGAMLALAHDWRVMRADRGFFCLPEVDIHIPFTVGMSALSKLTAHTAMTTGKRYGGADALAAGIVDATSDEDGLLAAAVAIAGPLAGKATPVRRQIKEVMYADALAALRIPAAGVELPAP